MPGYSCAYGYIHENGRRLDDAVLTLFRAPKSYTGEDVVEISCHGGLFLTDKALRLLCSNGAQPAGAGEFTRRAFLNGKMPLNRAEAVMELISAQGDAALRAARSLAEGKLAARIDADALELTDILGELSAWIDFPDEVTFDADDLAASVEARKASLTLLLREYDDGKAAREGLDAVVCGRPNVGKSTLMNLLLGHDRCIVDDAPGTTRDVIEETVNIGGIILKLSDTAGLRRSSEAAEAAGVDRAYKKIAEADLVICVFDNSEELSPEDMSLIRLLEDKSAVAVINKCDMTRCVDGDFITARFKDVARISAGRGEGYDEIREILLNKYERAFPSDLGLIVNERQRLCVVEALRALDQTINALRSGATLDAVGVLLEESLRSLRELTGENVSEAVMDNIFSRFCVGK
jgi:tRNA modification GTPase